MGEMVIRFRDRIDAGRALAAKLMSFAGEPSLLVLGLPRGGVPVAYEVAVALRAPLDVLVVRKLGVPGHEELAMGAIAPGGVCIVNEEITSALGIRDRVIERVAEGELVELERRERAYRKGHNPIDLYGSTVIVVDDGLATGSTMRAAVALLRKKGAFRIIVAAPVAAPSVCEKLRAEADSVVCAVTPRELRSVGSWYDDFSQTTDEEVTSLLEEARRVEAQPLFRRSNHRAARRAQP